MMSLAKGHSKNLIHCYTHSVHVLQYLQVELDPEKQLDYISANQMISGNSKVSKAKFHFNECNILWLPSID